ncbi:MAG: hypothetical protein AB7O04_02135, partial [Hyphomonadaceae bacterium]
LQSAAQARAVGETALLAALIAAEGAHTLDAEAAANLVLALRRVELADAARNFAVEALIGAS